MHEQNPYKFNGKELDAETGLYYYGARYYNPRWSTWLSVDPHAENYPNASPYCYVENNPIIRTDPDGRDWYEVKNDETGKMEIKWTELKSQDKLDEAGIQGNYLGEAFVHFEHDRDEKLGEDVTLKGKGANSSKVTIYGINGSEDINTYYGLGMTSDPDKHVPIADGNYKMFYQDMNSSVYGEKGAKAKGVAPALTYRVSQLDGNLDIPTLGNVINPVTKGRFKTAIFFHRTDWHGRATRSSTGCPNIDGRQWKNVEKQLGKSTNIYFRMSTN
ncbi:MAG: RHS repeat-associated core domain-containing protein [Luteibaculaceae bacterium]